MFWRMLPILTTDYDYVAIRDLDSVITRREADATNEWIQSGKLIHIMRDHPGHTAPIMGGMFSVKSSELEVREAFKPIKKIILCSVIRNDESYWQVDQEFLASHVYERLKHSRFVHDPYYERIEFGTEREMSYMYIGRPTMKTGCNLTEDDRNLSIVDQYRNQCAHISLGT